MPEYSSSLSLAEPEDSIRARTLVVLENHFNDLKNIQENSFEFKSRFQNSASVIPCDFCEKYDEKQLDDYVFLIQTKYPEEIPFTYEVDEEEMQLTKWDVNRWEVLVTVKTSFELLMMENGEMVEKKRSTYMDFLIFLDYAKNDFIIRSVEGKKSPSANFLALEFSPNYRISNADYANQPGFDGFSSRAYMLKFGASYYFYPFGGVNQANIWLKGGLRLGLIQSNFELDQLNFVEREVPLAGQVDGGPNHLDLERNILNLSESQTSVFLEVPIGISKRFGLSPKTDLSLELEASYSFEIFERLNGDYQRDQLGTNHFFINSFQQESGGELFVYDETPQAVLRESNGEIVEFYRNRNGILDDNRTETSGFLTFSFRPSLFIRSYEKIKYQIGLNISYLLLPESSTEVFTEAQFDPDSGIELSSINESDQNNTPLFIGILLGLRL